MSKRVIDIEGEILFARIYKLYNIIDNMVYIGSTNKTLVKRLGDHMYSYNIGINMCLYHHMRLIGITNFKMRLMECKIVENMEEMSALEQKWIDKENPKYLLNSKNANKQLKSLNSKRCELEDKLFEMKIA